MAGSLWYKKPPPTENIFGEVARIMLRAFSNKLKSKSKKKHWLDNYMDTHVCESDSKCLNYRLLVGDKSACQKKNFIDDVKSLFRLLIMFLPVPMFWALYDQQGSIWLIQGIQMDCRLSDNLLLLPDQIQTPLRKMVAGGLLASLSFLVAGFVQLGVNETLPTLPNFDEAFVSIWNQLDSCTVTATFQGYKPFSIAPNMSIVDNPATKESSVHLRAPPSTKNWTVPIRLDYAGCTSDNYQYLPNSFNVELKTANVYYVAVSPNGVYQGLVDPSKPTQGTGEFSLGYKTSCDFFFHNRIVTATTPRYDGNLVMCRMDASGFDPLHPCDPRSPSDFYYWETNYNDGTDDRVANSTYVTALGRANEYAVDYAFKPVKPGNDEVCGTENINMGFSVIYLTTWQDAVIV
ncbi:hypothetical protein DICVIV_10347 [Dictyocaulus viviparus]|uniref:Uncharacterized protein n=1 Tax=Dictyocaulus viviparus TaxID=29172 RepID=A0A0D8XIN0_DICVI|nr:hypothetical protein DICVIV_10347 [Dictyocaulus viviparus]